MSKPPLDIPSMLRQLLAPRPELVTTLPVDDGSSFYSPRGDMGLPALSFPTTLMTGGTDGNTNTRYSSSIGTSGMMITANAEGETSGGWSNITTTPTSILLPDKSSSGHVEDHPSIRTTSSDTGTFPRSIPDLFVQTANLQSSGSTMQESRGQSIHERLFSGRFLMKY
jgi:hypothetical protein